MELSYFKEFNKMKFTTQIKCSYLDSDKKKIVVEIKGDMETNYSKQFNQAIQKLLKSETGIKAVILDFQSTRYVSSAFVASLLHMIQQAKSEGIELFFTNLLTNMQEVINSLGLGHFVVDIDMKKRGPLEVICNKCGEVIKTKNLGQIECPSCKAILTISDKGVIRDH